MARQTATSVQRNFKTGLITEASGLSYPEDACVETENCEFDTLGRVSRRRGLDLENGYVTETIDKSLSAVSSYLWKNVTGDGLLSFVVVQIGNNLHFYDTASTSALSAGYKTSTIDLTAFSPAEAATPRIAECQFADGFGKLFVVHPSLDAFYITYDLTTDTFTGTQIDIKIRDFEGMVDEQAFDVRPTSSLAGLSDAHEYNLRNQGWNTTVLTAWDTAFTTMPSNCDVWWWYKNSSDAFDTATVVNSPAGNTRAPKGHFVLNLYSQDRAAASGIPGIALTTTAANRASTTAFFAGRVWYSGVNYPNVNTKVYFSQIIERPDQFGLCYQQQDPTSDELFSLEPSDGGVISIPDAGTIFKLVPIQSALLVFAAKGVWAITGSAGIGFTANDYTLTKISSIRTVSATSFVDVNGVPIYWTADGIFTIKAQVANNGQVTFSVVPMTWTTIQTFYDAIPHYNKAFARGFFNPLTQQAQWLYKTTAPQTVEDNYVFDSILVFNAKTGAVFPWTISEGGVKVHGIFVSDAAGAQTVEYTVVDSNGDTVVDGSGNEVVAYLQSAISVAPTFKYIVSFESGGTQFTMADGRDIQYRDWAALTPVNYESYFITGYIVRGEAIRKFQGNYLYLYNEGSGTYDIQGIWDYSLTGNSGNYTGKQRLVYQDSSVKYLHKRVKLRGSGRALQYKVTSVAGEPFRIIGWSTLETANAAP